MNKKELLKQLEEAKNQIARLQNDVDNMQNIIDTIDDKYNNKPEFYFPERNEEYFFMDTVDFGDFGYFCEPSVAKWKDNTMDCINVMLNNVFRTEEECKIEIELLNLFAEIKDKALKEDELVPKNKVLYTYTDKYIIKYDSSDNQLFCSVFSVSYQQGIIPNCFFKTEEFAEKIIAEYGERIKALLNKKYRSDR